MNEIALKIKAIGEGGKDAEEKRLWQAVLCRAIEDLWDTNKKYGQLIRSRARPWIWSEKDGVASFVWVCDAIDVCPSKIRRKIKEFSNIKIAEKV